ncbi:hypothetical protein ACWAT4_24115 [Bradyrhizobium manausense]
MKTPEWPGIATLVGIILIGMIASDLSKWQTLAAALIAFGGAALAYRGAIAKVQHDRAIVERDDMRRKLALYLKLDFAFGQLIEKARSRGVKFTFAPGFPDWVFRASDFDLEEPPELEEAWALLDIFPRHLIAEIRNVRNSLRRLAAIKKDLGDKTVSPSSDVSKTPWIIEEAGKLMDDIWHSAAVVVEDLKPLVRELAPEMDESERMIKIHGEPGPNDFDDE